MAKQVLHAPALQPSLQHSLGVSPVSLGVQRRARCSQCTGCSYNFPESSLQPHLQSWALGSCIMTQWTRRARRAKISLRARRSDSEEDNLEKWLPFVAAGVFGLLALTPTLIVGSMAAWWAFALAATVGSLLYFSVAVPMMITAALVGGIIIPMIAANFLVASSLIASIVASLATAGAAGLLVWVSLGNPLPFPDFPDFSSKKVKAAEAKAFEEEDPFTDWDRRFAAKSPKSPKSQAAGRPADFEELKRQGAPTYLNVSPADQG